MTPSLDRRQVLAGGAAALAGAALTRPASAATATRTSIVWANQAYSTDTFRFEAKNAPVGAVIAVSWSFADGRSTDARANGAVFYSGSQPGWVKADASLFDRYGRRVAVAPTLYPPVATPAPSGPAQPVGAAAAGMNTLALSSTFADLSRIDTGRTGRSGFDWYTGYTWNTDRAQDPAKTLSVGHDTDGSPFLRVTPDVSNCNWTLSTFDQASHAGRYFTHGYFEATVRFTQVPRPTDWNAPASWASIWLADTRSMRGIDSYTNGEIDILEQLAGPNRWTGTLHEWPGHGSNVSGHHYAIGFGQDMDLSGWHTYGASWTKPDANGLSRVTWYVDGQFITSQPYSRTRVPVEGPGEECSDTPTGGDWQHVTSLPAGTFSCLEDDEMTFVLGTGVSAPMDVKSAQVWTY